MRDLEALIACIRSALPSSCMHTAVSDMAGRYSDTASTQDPHALEVKFQAQLPAMIDRYLSPTMAQRGAARNSCLYFGISIEL